MTVKTAPRPASAPADGTPRSGTADDPAAGTGEAEIKSQVNDLVRGALDASLSRPPRPLGGPSPFESQQPPSVPPEPMEFMTPEEANRLYTAGNNAAAEADRLDQLGDTWEHSAQLSTELGDPQQVIAERHEIAAAHRDEADWFEQEAIRNADALDVGAAELNAYAEQLEREASMLYETLPPLPQKGVDEAPQIAEQRERAGYCVSQAQQARAGAAELEKRAELIRLNVEDRQSISVATYNTYKYNTGAEVESLTESHDIIGLQEVDQQNLYLEQVTIKSVEDTHGIYYGEAAQEHDGKRIKTSSYTPILYNKERFELIEGESVQLHGEDFNGEGGSDRYANFVVLKDKTDGALVLVVNTHWSNTSLEAKQVSKEVIDQQIAEFKAEYPIDGVVVLGDFNTPTPNIDGMEPTAPTPGEGTDGHQGIDHILVDDGVLQSDYKTSPGGSSDHDVVSSELLIR